MVKFCHAEALSEALHFQSFLCVVIAGYLNKMGFQYFTWLSIKLATDWFGDDECDDYVV